MAKLCSSYSLCPLIERRNFLGVSDDSLPGYVIVTLAKNIVIRYKLSDQKQVSSWSSKDKLSAPVVYDSLGKQYIGVFKGDQVAFWKEDSVTLNKLKKHKFALLIHGVLTTPGHPPVLVYKNGAVFQLSVDPESRKNPQCDFLLPSEQKLEEANICNISGVYYVYLYAKDEDKEGSHWFYLTPMDPDKGNVVEIKLVREEEEKAQLMAYTVMDIENCQLVTLWSDGKVFSMELGGSDQFPGRSVCSLTQINCGLPSIMQTISANHVAIYGADTNSEGAVLALLNTRFGVVQCSSHMKLYCSNSPRLWRCGQSVVLVIGQYLAVVPYQLATARLASLVGSHTGAPARPSEKEGGEVDKIPPVPTEKLEERIDEMLDEGLTQNMICEELFGGLLERDESKGIGIMLWKLSDIPDKWIVRTVVHCLARLPKERSLLDKALHVQLVNDSSTLCLVRASLSLDSALDLLQQLQIALEKSPADLHLVAWVTLLLDSHYQQYLLSKDEKVVQTITRMKELVDQFMEYMEALQGLKAYTALVKSGMGFSKKTSITNQTYFIEKLQLY